MAGVAPQPKHRLDRQGVYREHGQDLPDGHRSIEGQPSDEGCSLPRFLSFAWPSRPVFGSSVEAVYASKRPLPWEGGGWTTRHRVPSSRVVWCTPFTIRSRSCLPTYSLPCCQGCLVIFLSNFLALLLEAEILEVDDAGSTTFSVALVTVHVLFFLSIWWNAYVSMRVMLSRSHVQVSPRSPLLCRRAPEGAWSRSEPRRGEARRGGWRRGTFPYVLYRAWSSLGRLRFVQLLKGFLTCQGMGRPRECKGVGADDAA